MILDLYLEHKIIALYHKRLVHRLAGSQLLADTTYTPEPSAQVHIVKDVPEYFKLEPNCSTAEFEQRSVSQYEGMLVKLDSFTGVQYYLNTHFNKRNRKNLNSKLNRLVREHKTSFATFYGKIQPNEHETHFEAFRKLLSNRFAQKKIANRDLQKWHYLKEISFSMINQKKASLFAIYVDNIPVALTLNFHLQHVVFSHMQTFDVSFSRYGLGDIAMLKQLEWCFNNNVKIFDFLIGKSYYKSKWANHIYRYDYHIFHKKGNLFAKIVADFYCKYYGAKQYLREKKIAGNIIAMDKLYFIKKRLM